MTNYDSKETYSKVVAIVAEILNADASAIKPDSNFESLGADSLDMLEIIMKLEETFGIEISDEQAAQIKTVGEAVDNIQKIRTK
jgi:acyl carrier protein